MLVVDFPSTIVMDTYKELFQVAKIKSNPSSQCWSIMHFNHCDSVCLQESCKFYWTYVTLLSVVPYPLHPTETLCRVRILHWLNLAHGHHHLLLLHLLSLPPPLSLPPSLPPLPLPPPSPPSRPHTLPPSPPSSSWQTQSPNQAWEFRYSNLNRKD